jgi:branched-chain amino acid transport system permease protein
MVSMDYFIELLLGGLTRGSIYALIALGYTMVYGIIELINFAHGEIYMIGAFTALIVSSVLAFYGFPAPAVLILAFVVAVFYAAAYGFTVEKIAYKPLRQAPRLSPLSVPSACLSSCRTTSWWPKHLNSCLFPTCCPNGPF